jgi:succinyl-CoA synthetase beta subunit
MMKIHEYQAKEFFEAAGMPVPSGTVVTNPDDAYAAAKAIGKPVVVKAQVLVGGRGKAGGVKRRRKRSWAWTSRGRRWRRFW